jgi:enolase
MDTSIRSVRAGAVKYNQLMRIEESLGDSAVYAGRHAFVTRRAS